MRVVIVSRIFSPEPSAASYLLEAIAEAYRDAGHDVRVLTTRAPKGLPPASLEGIELRRAPVLRDRTGYVRGYLPYMSFDIPLAFRLLFAGRSDLIVVEPPPTTGAVVRVVAGLRRIPYFYDAADVWSDAARLATSSRVVLGLLRRLEVFALRGARRAFTISTGVANRLRELDVHVPTTIVAFGADADVFRHVPDAVDAASPYFIYPGTYSEVHGAGVFLDAFAQFAAAHPGHRLLYVGNGTERAVLERRTAELGVVGVEFHEPVDGVRLNALLSGATASLASLRPGTGYDYAFTTKVYSSIAAGCPVVFSGVGPTAGFIETANHEQRAGRALPYDPAAVAGALAEFTAHPVGDADRARLSDWARERFSLRSIAESIVAESIADVEAGRR